MKTKNIGYVTSMATGGLAGFNYRELKELLKLGTSVTLFITKYRSGPYMPPEGIGTFVVDGRLIVASLLKNLFQRPGIIVRQFLESLRLKSTVDFLIGQHWARIVQQRGCRWIHCHWGDHKLFAGYYMSRLSGVPLSVTMHGYDLYDSPNWAMLERALEHCSRIVTISDYNRKYLSDKYPRYADKIVVVRLSADLEVGLDAEKNRIHILIVGGFQSRKGYDDLLKAIKVMDRDDVHLWVVGYKGTVDVRRMVRDLGLEDKVTIFGAVSDEVIKLLYVYCDIFCLPSKFGARGVGEGLPVALMEAMAYGKPIVSTRHTGIPELVPEILVDEGDHVALAKALAALADSPGMRSAMGERNRKIVEQGYSNENVRLLLEQMETRS